MSAAAEPHLPASAMQIAEAAPLVCKDCPMCGKVYTCQANNHDPVCPDCMPKHQSELAQHAIEDKKRYQNEMRELAAQIENKYNH